LSFEPSLMLLDEPLSSLDKKLREEMRQELLRIHRETNVTTVHVTHNQEEALTMADRVAVIQEGEIAQHSPTQELYARPQNAFVADFVGNTNMIEGRVESIDPPNCTVKLAGTEQTIDCRTDLGEGTVNVGDSVSVGIRFEEIDLGDSVSANNIFDGTVTDVVFKGNFVDTTVRIDGIETTFQVSDINSEDARVFARGDGVRIGWDATDCLVYTT